MSDRTTNAPGADEAGVVVDDASAEVGLGRCVVQTGVDRAAEDVVDLVPVHHAHPVTPRVQRGPLQQTYRHAWLQLRFSVTVFFRKNIFLISFSII